MNRRRQIQLTPDEQAAFFRNVFLEDAATNHSPASDLGFTYAPTLSSALGDPYLIISGYTDVGNPITGPQNTYQNYYQGYYSLAWTRGTHNFKFGADIDRDHLVLQAELFERDVHLVTIGGRPSIDFEHCGFSG